MSTKKASATQTRVVGAQLVGSVALADTDEVFDQVLGKLGRHLHRVPDGETEGRNVWIRWLVPALQANPALEVGFGADPALPQVSLKEGVDPATIEFGELGYGGLAAAAYAKLLKRREAGDVSADVRLQVSIPAPLDFSLLFAPTTWPLIEAKWEEALLADVARVVAAVPAQDLAIQWDLCAETLMLDGAFPLPQDTSEDDVYAQVKRLSEAVPSDVELGYHLCYGDYEHKHAVEPKDTGVMVGMINRLTREIERPINWVQMPVPQDRTDRAYFAPLADLEVSADTEIYLGLVGYHDSLPDAEKRVAAAQEFLAEFGVATECGMGRCDPDEVPGILAQHAQLADAIRS